MNSAFARESIDGKGPMRLCGLVAEVLRKGLDLLGIEVLERM